ncbi:hypothetical protein MRX96_015882 [Rhipicephalus microplus]
MKCWTSQTSQGQSSWTDFVKTEVHDPREFVAGEELHGVEADIDQAARHPTMARNAPTVVVQEKLAYRHAQTRKTAGQVRCTFALAATSWLRLVNRYWYVAIAAGASTLVVELDRVHDVCNERSNRWYGAESEMQSHLARLLQGSQATKLDEISSSYGDQTYP